MIIDQLVACSMCSNLVIPEKYYMVETWHNYKQKLWQPSFQFFKGKNLHRTLSGLRKLLPRLSLTALYWAGDRSVNSVKDKTYTQSFDLGGNVDTTSSIAGLSRFLSGGNGALVSHFSAANITSNVWIIHIYRSSWSNSTVSFLFYVYNRHTLLSFGIRIKKTIWLFENLCYQKWQCITTTDYR